MDVGVIDRDYRGEVKASLRNNSPSSFEINVWDRLVQLIFKRICEHILAAARELADTSREGGFGSPGSAS